MSTPKIGFAGVGSYLPPTVLGNDDLSEMVDTSDDWIRRRTGVETRRILQKNETILDMAVRAAKAAMMDAGVAAEDIGDIRVGVNTWLRFPSLATQLQAALGARSASASDISAGCSGFVYAVESAYHKIFVEKLRHGRDLVSLVVGVDGLSHIVDWTDRTTCVLHGDGAGAAVLTTDVDRGEILATHTSADGRYGDSLYLDPPVSNQMIQGRKRLGHDMHSDRPYMHMDGRKVFAVACKTMVEDIQGVIEKYSATARGRLSIEDVDYIYPHQANGRIIEAVARKLGVPLDRVYTEGITKYGNTSAASIPIGYCDMRGRDDSNPRDRIEIDVAFGAGFASGAILRRGSAGGG